VIQLEALGSTSERPPDKRYPADPSQRHTTQTVQQLFRRFSQSRHRRPTLSTSNASSAVQSTCSRAEQPYHHTSPSKASTGTCSINCRREPVCLDSRAGRCKSHDRVLGKQFVGWSTPGTRETSSRLIITISPGILCTLSAPHRRPSTCSCWSQPT
jgi:hypothetical protein